MNKEFYFVLGKSGREYIYVADSMEHAIDQHSRHQVGKNDPISDATLTPLDEIGENDD